MSTSCNKTWSVLAPFRSKSFLSEPLFYFYNFTPTWRSYHALTLLCYKRLKHFFHLKETLFWHIRLKQFLSEKAPSMFCGVEPKPDANSSYHYPRQIRVVNAFRHGMDSQQLQQATSNVNLQRVLQKQASLGKRYSTASSTCQQEAAVAVASRLARTAASKQAMAMAASPPPAQQPPPPPPPTAPQLLPPSSCSISSARKFSASEQQQSYSHTETAV